MKNGVRILALLFSCWQAPAWGAACPAGDWVCKEKRDDWNKCRADNVKNPGVCGAEPGPTPPQGFKVVDAKQNICEADDGQKFPCGQPTPLHDDRNKGGPPVNRAEDWDPAKYNKGMFDTKIQEIKLDDGSTRAVTQRGDYAVVIVNQGAPCPPGGIRMSDETDTIKDYCKMESKNGTFGNQADAFVAHNNLLIACTGTNIEGRLDTLCTTTPNHPECTGLQQSLANGVFCNDPPPPGSPPDAPCRSYGAYTYTIDEWLVFSQQYYDGMTGCITAKDGVDPHAKAGSGALKSQRAANMTALTDMVSFPPASGDTKKDGSSSSTITGKTKIVDAETRAKEMMERFDDGAQYLGFNKGELILRAYKGESFMTAFSDSPFAEKLSKTIRETVDYALGNPAEKIEKVKEKRVAEIEKKRQEAEARGETLADDRSLASTITAEPASLAVIEASAAQKSGLSAAGMKEAIAAAGTAAPPENPAASLRWDGLGRTSLPAGPGSYAAQVQAAEETRKGTEGLASQAALEEDPNLSLFQRVSLSYRRHTPRLKAYQESNTARDIRLTDKPEFFKDL